MSRSLVFRALSVFFLFLLPLSAGLAGQYRFLERSGSFHNGAESGFLSASATRFKIDLEGQWGYSVDGGPSGTVTIPSAYDFAGKVTFQRTFAAPAVDLSQYRFHLVGYGISNTSEITVNNDLVAHHGGGYTSFSQLIPPNTIQPGSDNVIRVLVSNELDQRHTLPLRPLVWQWKNYGGIVRDIYILATPTLFLRDVAFTSEPAEKSGAVRIAVRAQVDGVDSANSTLGFSFELFDKITGLSLGRSGVTTFTKDGREAREVRSDLAVSAPKLWSPDSPDLYLLRCTLLRVQGKAQSVVDVIDQTVGIRQLNVQGGHILLNGKRIVLKGVNWNEDSPVSGSALTYEERERDIVLMKNLGANTVRFAGRPPHPYMLDLCDRYGLLALEELPLNETPGPVLDDESYLDQAMNVLREMIGRDRNHPSVLAWGFGNEFDMVSNASREAVRKLGETARSLDHRPTYIACRALDTDQCSDLVDIAAVNIHTRETRDFRKELEGWRARHPAQPVVVSEFGTEVQHENRRGSSDPLSQEAQARFYLQRLDLIRSLDYDGAIVGAFNDWAGDRPALTIQTGDPWVHSVGLVNQEREKRLGYEAVRAAFHGEKIGALPIGSYSLSAPIIYVLVGFVILVAFAYLYNASRRFRENLNRSLLNSFNFYADVRDQRSVSMIYTTLLGIAVSIATALVVSSLLFHFRDDRLVDNILSFVLVFDSVKAIVVKFAWRPLQFIGIFSAVFFVLLVLLSGVVHTARIFFRTRLFPLNAYSVTIWSVSPLLFFIPIGMILYRVMESSMYVVPSLLVVGALLVWVFLRLLKGVAIVFDVPPLKMYFIGIFVVLCAGGLAYAYYDYTAAVPMYLNALYNATVHTL